MNEMCVEWLCPGFDTRPSHFRHPCIPVGVSLGTLHCSWLNCIPSSPCLPRCFRSVLCQAPSTQKVTIVSHRVLPAPLKVHTQSRRNFEQRLCENISWPTPSLLLPLRSSWYCWLLGNDEINGLQAQTSSTNLALLWFSPYKLLLILEWEWEMWFPAIPCPSLNKLLLPREAGLTEKTLKEGDIFYIFWSWRVFFFFFFRRKWTLILHYIGTSVYFSFFLFVESDIV